MTETFAFPSRFRVKDSEDYRQVYARKRSVSDDWLILYARENDREYSRMGMSVSRKVGKAVLRNRIRRLYREAFRLKRAELPMGLDFIFIPRKKGEAPTLEHLLQALPTLAERVARKLARDRKQS